MASIKNESNGRKTILVICPDGKRRSIRLGKATMPHAKKIKNYIEDLVSAKKANEKPEPSTIIWLKSTTPEIRQRIINAGLHRGAQREKQKLTLREFTDKFIAARKRVKPATREKFEQVQDCLLRHFGEDKPVDEVNGADALAWVEWLATEANIREGKERLDGNGKMTRGRRDLADSTVSRRTGIAKQFFNWAIKAELLPKNPFEGIPCTVRANKSRQYFVTQEVASLVIDHAPDAKWRAIIALSRYGGPRTPSETVRLRWEDIDFANGRMRIHASKTEHHADKGIRFCPLFPVLAPFIEDLWELVKDSQPDPATPIIDGGWDASVNLRTGFLRILKNAGVAPWPKLFQNMRASRETELLDEFPIKDVCGWIGNTQSVAMENYAMQRESSFQRALTFDERVPKEAHFTPEEPQNTAQQSSAADVQNTADEAGTVGEFDVFPGKINEIEWAMQEPHKREYIGKVEEDGSVVLRVVLSDSIPSDWENAETDSEWLAGLVRSRMNAVLRELNSPGSTRVAAREP